MEKDKIKLCSYDECTGCGACANICGHKAIVMEEVGRSGEVHPHILESNCIGCGLCMRVCPQLGSPLRHEANNALAAWAKDDWLHKSSASGGVGSALAEYFIKSRNGIVYGCESSGPDVKHVRIDHIDQLSRLKGSKYVQSSIGMIYREVHTDLLKGVDVLFIGTPCQIAGLNCFLMKKYDNLTTVDLVCHGTPPQKLFRQHIEGIAGDRRIDSVKFRSEDGFCLNILSNGESIYKNYVWKRRYADAYYTAFMKGYTFRESCYRCKYANSRRVSDITIGDFWGLPQNFLSPQIRKQGVSVILCNTTRGKETINDCSSIERIVRPLNEAIEGNAQLKHPFAKNFSVKIFRTLFNRHFSLKNALYTTDFYLIPLYKLKENLKK